MARKTRAWTSTFIARFPATRKSPQNLCEDRVISEQTHRATGPLEGSFETAQLKPGIYTLRAMNQNGAAAPVMAQLQLIVAPDPFDWQAPAR